MATRKKTTVETAVAKLSQALVAQYDQQNSITREGTQLTIPANMSIQDAILILEDYLRKMEQRAEKVIRFENVDEGDTLIAFKRVMERLFGNVTGEAVYGFMKYDPGAKSVTTAFGQQETVPFGEIKIPGLDVKIDLASSRRGPMLDIVQARFTYKRKFQPLVEQVEAQWRAWLATNSIFKGQAINSALEFLDLGSAAKATDRLVYTAGEAEALGANIFTPIMNQELISAAGIMPRRTVVLSGPYGTGKTLTALLVAQEAVKHGWTFMSVLPGHSIAPALEFARKFQPAVLFFEDIDVEASGPVRDDRMNEILNTMDGVVSKTSQVVTIMTTNHLDRLARAMLRPGRIDAVIEMGHVDEQSIVDLVRAHAGEYLMGDLNGAELLAEADGMTPAFVVEAAQKAVLYSLNGNGHERPEIRQEHVLAALRTMRPQWELMNSDQDAEMPAMDKVMRQAMVSALKDYYNE